MSSSADGSEPPRRGTVTVTVADNPAHTGRTWEGRYFFDSILIRVSTLNSPSKNQVVCFFFYLLSEFTNLSLLAVKTIYLCLIETPPGKAPYFHLDYFSFVHATFYISFLLDSSSKVQLDYGIYLECLFWESR